MDPVYLSVVLPAYKESARISATLLSLQKYFKDKNYEYEIIVVNDGSPDTTALVVKKLFRKVKNLRLIDNVENMGKGFAVKTGMLEARGRYRLFMDADNSVTIDAVEAFLGELQAGYDMVIGSISLPGAQVHEHSGWHRRFFGSIVKLIVRNLATPGIYDTQRGFKLFTAKAANIIFERQTILRFGFDVELLVIAATNGMSVKELPVKWDNPAGSTVHLKDYIKSMIELVKILARKLRGDYNTSDGASIFVNR